MGCHCLLLGLQYQNSKGQLILLKYLIISLNSHQIFRALWLTLCFSRGSVVKNLPANAEDMGEVSSLGRQDPLEEETATHSRILAWRIPWTEAPGGLQSMGLQRVRQDWSDYIILVNFMWLVTVRASGHTPLSLSLLLESVVPSTPLQVILHILVQSDFSPPHTHILFSSHCNILCSLPAMHNFPPQTCHSSSPGPSTL